MATPIRFLFDYVSPYAYLASTQIHAIGARHGRPIELAPVLFAGMLDATGARGPAELPLKRAYMHRDVDRLAASLGVPVEPPVAHPFNPLLALRATTATRDVGARRKLSDGLFRAAWVESRRIDDADVVASIAHKAGLKGDDVVRDAASAPAKAALRASTDEAIASGAFGVPSMLVEGELFWGVDSLPLLERFLRGEDRPVAARLERWRALAPAAVRKLSG